MELLIYCSGGLSREYCDIADRVNKAQNRWDKISFIDDNEELVKEGSYYGKELINFDSANKKDKNSVEFVIANGNPETRGFLFDKMINAGFKAATVIDPRATVSPSAKIKPGAVISANVLVSSYCEFEENVLLLPGCVIGHDVKIGKHSFVCCCSAIGGNCVIGDRVYIGENAPVREQIKIGNDSIVSMGAVVLRDIPEGVIASGNPARAMLNNTDKKVFGK